MAHRWCTAVVLRWPREPHVPAASARGPALSSTTSCTRPVQLAPPRCTYARCEWRCSMMLMPPVCRYPTPSSPADLWKPLLPGKLFGRVRRAEPLGLAAICSVAGRVGDVARLRRGAGSARKGLLWAVGRGWRGIVGGSVSSCDSRVCVLVSLARPEPLAGPRSCYTRCGGRTGAHLGEGSVGPTAHGFQR